MTIGIRRVGEAREERLGVAADAGVAEPVGVDADSGRASRAGVAVVIPNWNGAHLLPECLASLRVQTLAGVRIVVVDDGSTDESVRLLERAYPDVALARHQRQRGFCAAVNTGIATALSGPMAVDYVALLNNDATAEPGWLKQSVETLEAHPECAGCTPKILLADAPGTINSIGLFLKTSGASRDIGFGEPDDGRYDQEREVFGFTGCAVVLRRRALEDVGLLDEWLFAYCEDLDWSIRARLHGYSFRFQPMARVHHRQSATFGRIPGRAARLKSRNSLYVLLKNLPAPVLLKHGPSMLGFQIYQLLVATADGQPLEALSGKLGTLRSWSALRTARRAVLRDGRNTTSRIEHALLFVRGTR